MQNQNCSIAIIVDTVMNTPIEVFFMCFLEKGHIENTADEIRTLTEREEDIFMYSPRDQMVLMRQTKTKNITINAKLLDLSNFLDLKRYAQKMAGKSDILLLKNEYNQPMFQQMNLLQIGGKRKRILH